MNSFFVTGFAEEETDVPPRGFVPYGKHGNKGHMNRFNSQRFSYIKSRNNAV